MGSFAYTCAISGLPIEAGDKVRYLLLTKNPYHSGAENTCYIHDLWFPRTFPLKGSYNDYGSVEKVTAGAEREIWLEGLDKDMVERGWGENSCHDVPTKKSMKFDELLNAVQEGRILVQREYNHYGSMEDRLERIDAMLGKKKRTEDTRSPEEKRDSKVPAGVPTMYRVQKIAEKLSLAIYDGSWSKPSIIIDSPKTGEVRIRCHCMYGEKLKPDEKFSAGAAVKQQVEVLSALQEALGEYSTMISTSSDGCAVSVDRKHDSPHYIQPNTELLVRPKPGTHDGEIREADKKEPLPVGHAMIREDVWQALIKNNTVEHWSGKKTVHIGIDAFYEGVNNYVKYLKTEMKSDYYKKYGPLGGRLETHNDNPGAWIATQDIIPFTIGLASHFNIMMGKDEVPEGFFKTVAEFAFINSVLAQTRYQWRTSSSAGPQFGEWEKHENLLKSLADLAHKHAEKQKAERAKWDL